MKLIWKSVAALVLAGSALTAVPAQAQYYGGGYRDGGYRDGGWRDDRGYRDDRRWDRGRRWDGDRRHGWRNNHRRCWSEWRRGYRGERVRVRICR